MRCLKNRRKKVIKEWEKQKEEARGMVGNAAGVLKKTTSGISVLTCVRLQVFTSGFIVMLWRRTISNECISLYR